MFEEKTWEWATTPDDSGFAPIEGKCMERDDDWRAEVLKRLEGTEQFPNCEFIVCVQVIALDSSKLGAHNVVMAGANHTWTAKQIEELKENPNKYWYGDLPSERMYPQWYISREKHLATKGS